MSTGSCWPTWRCEAGISSLTQARSISPEETDKTSEFGCRYFEGAAAGTIVIGERPRNAEFDRIFHWRDALIGLPFGAGNIAEVMYQLDKQPERQAAARRKNMVEMLLHHDWAYRWEHVLNLAKIPAAPGLAKRKEKLRELADMVSRAPIEP